MRNSIDEDEEDRIQFVSLRANQFPWAVMRGIFNKKLDISCGFPFAFLSLLPLFRRERKATEENSPRVLYIRVFVCVRVCVCICRSVTIPYHQNPLNNPRASSPYKQRFASVVLSIPFSPWSGHLTPMADHLLPRFIFSHLRALMKTSRFDRSRLAINLFVDYREELLILLAIFHDYSSNTCFDESIVFTFVYVCIQKRAWTKKITLRRSNRLTDREGEKERLISNSTN